MSEDYAPVTLHANAPSQAKRAILGAMAAIAETDGSSLRPEDAGMIEGAWRFIFGEASKFDLNGLERVAPDGLASSVDATDLRDDAIKFLAVMSVADGAPDAAKVDALRHYADALGVKTTYLDLLVLASSGHIQEAIDEMNRRNMDSITNGDWRGGNSNVWLLPYVGDAVDPALAARFHALADYPVESFGRAFHHQFTSNNYAFPGEPAALNAKFSLPHDGAHVIAGYDTSPRGEILVSVFTSTMHKRLPMSGHVLPVIFIWHLKIQLNQVGVKAQTPMDPANFWLAWSAGAASKADTFAPNWDFWALAEKPLIDVRKSFGLPVEGLDAWTRAHGFGAAA